MDQRDKWKGRGIKDVGDYKLYYSGVKESQDAYGGVGIAVKKSFAGGVSAFDLINERLMWLRFNAENLPTTFIMCYAPTEKAKDRDKDKFYDELDQLISAVHERDMLVVMGDFNARVGRDHETCKGVLGRHGLERDVIDNDNGHRLLELCANHGLCKHLLQT